MASPAQPILIIGAGISGLTLAQACRKRSLPFRIFERDSFATPRSAGWGLTLTWSLPAFKELLPHAISERLPEAYVNKQAVDAGEKGSFTFFNLTTGQVSWQVPANERIRVSRDRLRNLLLSGLEVEDSKALTHIESTPAGVTAFFSDGSQARGCVVVGCDGVNSHVRRLCHPNDYRNEELPVGFLGAAAWFPEGQIAAMRELDPFFLSGACPTTDILLWFSFLELPGDGSGHVKNANGEMKSADSNERMYYCQVSTHWPRRPGLLGRADPIETPCTSAEQLALMRTLTKDWADPFRSIVHNIPSDSEVLPIKLKDWLPRRTTAFEDGRVFLIGDAAHTMTMYRGDGANQAIRDVEVLMQCLGSFSERRDGHGVAEVFKGFRVARNEYEDEMVERAKQAVLASRKACFDAHDWKRMDETSPLVTMRSMKASQNEK